MVSGSQKPLIIQKGSFYRGLPDMNPTAVRNLNAPMNVGRAGSGVDVAPGRDGVSERGPSRDRGPSTR